MKNALLTIVGRSKTVAVGTVLLGCILLWVQPQAKAAVTTYYSASSFNAASMQLANYSFSTPAGSTTVTPAYTDGPLTFAGNPLYLVNDSFYGSARSYLETTGSTLTITLSGATALSFTLGSTNNNAASFNVTVNGVATGPFSVNPAPATGFYGLTSTSPMTNVTFTSASGSNLLSTLSFQVGSAVPEPSTWGGLIAGAMGVLVLQLGRRRRIAS